MTTTKIIITGFALLLGAALGLGYGWVINPIQYTDITPNTLREDYRNDYILTVAEAYQADFDENTAARRLAILGSETPANLVAIALTYANQNGFTENEIEALQTLLSAMQTYQPQELDIP